MKNIRQFKSDKYRKSRGGHSRWLLLHCEKCGHEIATYQKDGPGILKRLYLDRIIEPQGIGQKKNKQLVCSACKTVLGLLTMYEKENRPAYRLFAGALGKKIQKGDQISNVKLS